MKIFYLIYKGYAGMVKHLPERVVYIFSDVFALFFSKVMRYRYDVITRNLERSFPDASPAFVRKVRKKFYRNFLDIFHEVLHWTRYSSEELLKRITFENPEMVTRLLENKRNVILVAGHYGNWELLGLTLPLVTGHKTFGVAKAQSNLFFDREINRMRTRMGLEIVTPKGAYRAMLKQQGSPFAAFLIADQSPLKHEIEYQTTFLHQNTPVLTGPESMARAMSMAVVFTAMSRVSRGRYHVRFTLVAEDPAAASRYQITEKQVRILEKHIQDHPEEWLWSHKRWKYAKDNTSTHQG